MIQSISVVLAVISPLSFPVPFSLVQGKDLSVLFTFSENQLLVSLILSVVSLVSISLTSTLIFIISFLLLNSVFFFELLKVKYSSFQFSHSVMSDSLWSHEPQARQASLSITNSQSSPKLLSSSQWCHPAISSSVIPFSSRPQSLPASESFPMSQLFAWDGQSIGVSALASVLPKNTQDWSPLEWTLGSPCSPRDSQESSPTPQFKSINSSHLHLPNSPCAPVCYIIWAVCLLSFWFLFLRLFLTWTILKLLLNLLPHCFFFVFPFFWLGVVWDLGSLTTGRWILNHWTSRGLPSFVMFL